METMPGIVPNNILENFNNVAELNPGNNIANAFTRDGGNDNHNVSAWADRTQG